METGNNKSDKQRTERPQLNTKLQFIGLKKNYRIKIRTRDFNNFFLENHVKTGYPGARKDKTVPPPNTLQYETKSVFPFLSKNGN
jgi:hypothetical protein